MSAPFVEPNALFVEPNRASLKAKSLLVSEDAIADASFLETLRNLMIFRIVVFIFED